MSWSEQTVEQYNRALIDDTVLTTDQMIRKGETFTGRDPNIELVVNVAHNMGPHLFGYESPTAE